MVTSSQILAHRGAGKPQSLTDHLTGVSGISCALAKKLGLPLAGELLGLLHDLGKATFKFQEYLNGSPELQESLRGRIDHSTAGAQCLLQELQGAEEEASTPGLIGRWLALCIVSHHGGLIDCLTPDGGDKLKDRLSRADSDTRLTEAWRSLDEPVRARIKTLLQDPALVNEARHAVAAVLGPKTSGDHAVQFGLFTRMLFSCLIDADRTNTADHENEEAARHRQHQQYASWNLLIVRFAEGLLSLASGSAVGVIRAQVSDECFSAATRPQGAYTLTVPTGGGKTLAALRFALEHARIHGLERVVFVSPYISIVEQNADVARKILEPEGVPFGSIVLEHHSNLPTDNEKLPARDQWRARVLAENWDAPVVFTTMAQLLEAFFGPGTRAVRRLHSLAKAVIVFDEVQTLPIRAVHLFNNAVNLLTTHCGSTVLLCTATQPLLHTVDKTMGAARLAGQSEIIADVPTLFHKFKRYQVFDHTNRPGGWTREQVAELVSSEAMEYGSCLAIVNTQRDAREIFDLCRTRAAASWTVLHLSTAMCPAHRLDVFATLKRALDSQSHQGPVICISTQLIEAGVDIDFACVVRDLAGLDSLAQAAGRCNRHGNRPQQGRVHLVHLPDLPKELFDIVKGSEVAMEVLGIWGREHPEQPFPLDSPEQMRSFYEYAYERRKDEMVYPVKLKNDEGDDTMMSLLGRNLLAVNNVQRQGRSLQRSILLQSFKTANEAFELIGPTHGIVSPYGTSGKEIINELAASADLKQEWQKLRKAQQYTLSVFPHRFRRLQEAGAIYAVKGGAGVYCLRPEFYDKEYGLRFEAGTMEELFG